MNKFLLIIIIFIFTLITCNTAVAADTNHTYTLDNDFDNGTLIGVEHNTTHDQLQLSNNTSNSSGIVPPFIWVPNSNQGTVSKVDTVTGKELARYRTCPGNVSSYANPSRTTVDLYGNCWVGNRQIGTAVKIGLYENSQYIDRNHNGIIETSRDLNNDGIISDAELLPWGQDECVLYEVILIPGSEGTYTPGQYNGIYVNDYWNPGPRGLAVDSKNNVWIGTFGSMKYYYVSGATGQILKCIDISSTGHTPYGAVIDQNGILWSSGDTGNNILRLDPSNDSFIRINLNHIAYGLALDNNNHLFVSGLNDYRISRINVLTGEIEWTKYASYGQGIAVTPDGDVWTANNVQNTVSRFSNDGDLKATIPVGRTPTGVAVDREGKVWVVDVGDEYIHRIDPATNTIEITKQIPGGLHYGYSDMTGLIASTITTRRGIWTITHDSGLQNAPWGIISWNSSEPQGTSIKVRVRSSNNKQNWSDWEDTSNGSQLSSTPPGRYLQVETTLQILSGNVSPILYDLTVRAPIVDIALTSRSNNTTPRPGDIVQFILEARNNGPIDATGVKVNYRLPSGFEFISSSPAYNPSTHIWNVGNLTNGASTNLIIQARSTTPGRFISSAWASSQEYDFNITNNFALLSVKTMAQPLAPYQPPNQPPTSPNKNPGTVTTPVNPNSGVLKVAGAYKGTINVQSRHPSSTVPMQETGVPLNPSGLAILLIMFGNLARRKRIINNKFFWLFLAVCFIFITCGTVSAADNTTVYVSNSANGSGSNSDSYGASISSDGNYIAFSSYADNLVPDDNNGCSDIFVYDVNSGKTTRVSVSSNGSESNFDSYQPSISANGRYIAFTSDASNLVEGDTNYDADIFVHDMNSGVTARISISPTGENADDDSFAPSISADGRYVAFVSYAHNLVNDGFTDENYGTNIFLHDMVSGTTENITALDTVDLNNYYGQPSISNDGRYIAFTSGIRGSMDASAAYSEDDSLPDYSKVLVYDRITGITENVGVSSAGEEANDDCGEPSISADGRYVTFSSYADNLVSGDNNQMTDIFIHDRLLGTTSRVSISTTGEEANYDSSAPSISPDGSHIAFISWATNLVTGDNNEFADIFVRDLISGTTKRISVSYIGEEANDNCYGYSSHDHYANSDYKPSLNNNGSLITFSSYATNLVPFDNNGYPDVFLYGPVNNLYTVYGKISPNLLRSGDLTTIKAYAGSNTESIAVSILGNNYNLQKQVDGTWSLSYTIPDIPDGVYDVLLTAKNTEGNQTTSTLHFTVDNTPPTVVGSVNPNYCNLDRYPYVITITASSPDTDTQSVTATILGETFDMYRADEHTWILHYTVPNISDGVCPIILTAKDTVGNQGTDSINFTVDTTPPTVTGTITPNIIKSGDSFTITAISSPDTESVGVYISGLGFNYLTKQADGTWIYTNAIPQGYYDGNYDVSLSASDYAGNYGYASLEYILDNPPHIYTSYPRFVKPGDRIIITIYSDLDADKATVSIFNETFNMIKQGEDELESTWNINYTIPQVADGEYSVIFTVTDRRGNQATRSTDIWVDTVPPVVTGTLTPDIVKSCDIIHIEAYSDMDTDHIDALINGKTFAFRYWGWGRWTADCTVPQLSDGNYPVLLTAVDRNGNKGTFNLNITVDNTAPTINANITPNKFKIGDFALITALSDADTASISAQIFGKSYDFVQQVDGSWILNYQAPSRIYDGTYNATLTAIDQVGNAGTTSLNFTIDGIPTINAILTPKTVKNGQNIHITANTDPDVVSVTAWIMGGIHDLVKQDDSSWSLDYTVPVTSDGPYSVILIAKDAVGNQGTSFLNFNVDSSPVVNATLTPNLVKSGDALQINASTDTEVESMTARIFGDTINLIKQADGTWSLNYIVPQAFDGNYYAILTAINSHGNQGTAKLNFTVDNTPPMINFELTPGAVLPGGQLNITATTDDAENVSADFGTHETDLIYTNGAWNGNYAVSSVTALGSYPVILFASDKVGNVGNASVLYDVVASLSVINPDGTGGSTSGSQGGSIGGGTNSGTSAGSGGSTGGSSTGGSSGSNTSGQSQGGSNDGSQDDLSPGDNGPQQPDTPGPDDPGDEDTDDGSFWDDLMNLMNEILDFIWKILPFILLAVGVLMVAGFFYPPLGIAMLAIMSVLLELLSTIISLLLRLLPLLIRGISILSRVFGTNTSALGIFNFLNLLKFIYNPTVIGGFFLIMGILGRFSYTAFQIVISPVYQFFSQTLGAYSWSQLLDSIRKK